MPDLYLLFSTMCVFSQGNISGQAISCTHDEMITWNDAGAEVQPCSLFINKNDISLWDPLKLLSSCSINSGELTQVVLPVASHLTHCTVNCASGVVNTWFFLHESYFLQGFQGFGFGDGGFQMSFGIGAFPFGIFATAFNINDGRPPPGIYALHTSLSPWCIFHRQHVM